MARGSEENEWKQDVARRAAASARVQRRRGARADTRTLYYEAHSLLRTLRHHLSELPEPAQTRAA